MTSLSSSRLILLVSIFLIALANFAFFSNILEVYPLNLENSLFLLSLVILFCAATVFLLALLCFKYTIKPVIILILITSSFTAYFMDTYNVVIDESMIDNILKTDLNESMDLLSVKQFVYFLVLGLLPALYVYKLKVVHPQGWRAAFIVRTKLLVLPVLTIVLCVVIFGGYYASFFREHKPLRLYSNPSYYLYSLVKTIGKFTIHASMPLLAIAQDAKIPASDIHRELVILVVGETVRADHFSLNGYQRQTTPLLEQENIFNFTDVWACGTSTATSVPCMFSIYGQSSFTKSKADSTENILDILHRAGVNVLWLDNNSSSKGVADRVAYESYKTSTNNNVCDDIECRDEGMLGNLQHYIDTHPQGDIFIVLHQMGNHGPAYYKRYPKRFEQFTPVCQTNQLEQCSNQEISNAYDNAILYTDYFLSQTIALLKKNDVQFESSMLYISDHGESLGESGLYLHGLPYLFAPDAQKKVPMVMWFSHSFDQDDEIDMAQLTLKTTQKLSHDNLFHTILGLMEIETGVYDPALDILRH